MQNRALYLDVFYSLLKFLSPYTETKVKVQNKILWHKVNIKKKIWEIEDNYLKASAKSGYLVALYFFLGRRDYDMFHATNYAALGGQQSILRKMLWLRRAKKIRSDYTYYSYLADALEYAARGGHIKICEMLLELGADKLDWALSWAYYTDRTFVYECIKTAKKRCDRKKHFFHDFY